MAIERRLSKTSVFSSEIMKTAPADLDIVLRSGKYRDLRHDLVTAMNNGDWGVRVSLTAETPEELAQQIHNVINACWTWERVTKLEKLHGLKIRTHTVKISDPSQIVSRATIDMYFERQLPPDSQ